MLFYKRGARIIQEGEHGDKFYIIESGQVEVTQLDQSVKNKENHIRYLERGSMVGMRALLNRSELQLRLNL